jgi:hypothetical protein
MHRWSLRLTLLQRISQSDLVFGLLFLYGATQPSSDGPYKGEMWCVHGGRGKELGKHDYRDSRMGLEMMKRISTEEVVALVRKRLQDGTES